MARSDKSRSRSSSGGSHKAAGTGARTAKSAASGVPLPIPEGDNVHTQEALDVAAENDADEGEFDAEEYDGASSASTSIRSSILDHEYERGRRYHHYRHGRYPIPNDDVEQNRDAMKHAMHLEACDGELINAPIGEHPLRILDLATGTGLWAMDVADRYPGAEIVGVDLSPIQPSWVPPNVKFVVDDIEDEWVDEAPYDLIHMRHSCAYLRDVDALLRNCRAGLRPGGWVEFTDFGGYALCDDGTMPGDYAVNECFAMMREVMAAKSGANFLVANEHGENFRRAGFGNVRCRVIKTPIGTWPKDKTQRLIGMYFREVLSGLVTAMGNKPLREAGMTDDELEVFLASVRRALNDDGIHAYFNFIAWWGQKV